MIFTDRLGEAAGTVCDALSGEDYIEKLNKATGAIVGKTAISLCSADAALHTALFLCGAGRGDIVLVPSFTFYPAIATVCNTGAEPVFLDCDPKTRCVSAQALETALFWAELSGKPPKAVVIDDAFGSVPDFDVLIPLCKAYGVPVIELASDALFGDHKGTPCGGNGDYGVLSYSKFGGGGGALVCAGDDLAAAHGFVRAGYSSGENHDYRMHNIVAALDLALIGGQKKRVCRSRNNLKAVASALDTVIPPVDGDAASYALIRTNGRAAALKNAGFTVKTPPPAHTLPQYSGKVFFEHEPGFCVCRTFCDCCLVGMDISSSRRHKLINLLR